MQKNILKSLNKKLNQYDFIKNIIVLLSGSSVALLIPFLITPIISRFFTPEDFGLWGTYSAIIGLFAVIANGRYELALLLPKKENEAFNMYVGSILISVFISIISLILILIFGRYICEILNVEELYKWLFLVPFVIIILAIQQASNYWLNRKKRFKVLSSGRIIQSSTTGGLNLTIGKLFYFSGGLIVSTVIGQLFLALFYLKKIKLRQYVKYISITEIKAVLYKYREYPLKSGVGIFLNIIKEQAPIFLLAFYFDNVIVGFYTLIIRLFGVPLSLVAGSIGQVYYQKAIELNKNNKPVYPFFIKTTSRLVLFLIIPVILIIVWGEQIFPIIFGDEWAEAGKILVIFSVYYAIRLVVSSQSSLLLVFKKLTIEIIFNGIALILQITSLVIGGIKNDYYLSLYLIAISGSFMYSILGVYFMVLLKSKK